MSLVADKLGSLCWDFASEGTESGPHSIHPYPARFIPQIPRRIIELFHPGDLSPVLDPFCGSGTTNVEASEAGLPSVGIDLNPLATLVAKVKTTRISVSLGREATAISEAAKGRLTTGRFVIPDIPRVDHWFKLDVQKALAAVTTELNELKDPNVADALKVALSSIIVRVSNQDSDTRYAAVEKDVTGINVFQGFEKAASSLGDCLESLGDGLFSRSAPARIITKNLLSVQPDEVGKGIGLVVTSPPYPNAYEYWLYHKYRMYWLGMDPIAVRESEIGARPHYFKKNHQTELDFEHQMGRCFWLLSRVMKPGALRLHRRRAIYYSRAND